MDVKFLELHSESFCFGKLVYGFTLKDIVISRAYTYSIITIISLRKSSDEDWLQAVSDSTSDEFRVHVLTSGMVLF